MSMHKIPLTDLERSGLEKHGLAIGTPSQLSDAFRQGVKHALVTLAAQEPVGYAYENQDFIGSVIGAKGDWAPNEIPLYLAAGAALVPDMLIDSDDMAVELMEMLGRLSTVSSAIEAERKERTAPLLDAQKWLMNGYSPARIQLDALIAEGKSKLTTYNRAKAEAKRIADEAAAKIRREAAEAAARAEAEAMAAAKASALAAEELSKAGSEQAAQAMVTQAMVEVDTARANAQAAVQAVYTAPVKYAYSAPLKGTGGTWSAEVTDKAALIKHIGAMVAANDLSLIGLLDVSEKSVKAMAKMQQANLKLPGVRPVFNESISIRKQAVAA